ncbi:hypothetical protein [Bacteroides acidifaciens]|uniref:hypothetical protein n=1 Tax=Bacteroides acidifaciens TaxID=85831 RepID=UPI00263AE64A|nr:hypothetical protein [Bacteroides acidifaciens]
MKKFRDFILETTGLIAFTYDDADKDHNAEEWIRENISQYIGENDNSPFGCKTLRTVFNDYNFDSHAFDRIAYGMVKQAIQYVNSAVEDSVGHPVLIFDYRTLIEAVKEFTKKEGIKVEDDAAFRRMLPKYTDEVLYSLGSQQEFFEKNNATVIVLNPWHYDEENDTFNSALFSEGAVEEMIPTEVSFNTPFNDDENQIIFVKHKDFDADKTFVYEWL